MRLADVDLHDPETFVREVPHDAFRVMRKEAPIYFHKEPKGGPGFWCVTKHEDVMTVSKDPHTFSSKRGATNIQDYPAEDLSAIQMMMLNMDPPQHNQFRKLASTGFTPRMVARLEPRIRASAKDIIDQVIKKGETDFVTTIAAELPLRVIAELLGVPQEDRHKIFEWSNRLIGFDDPEFQTSLENGKEAAAELWMYASSLAEQRRETKGEDLVSVLINAEIDGERLSDMEFDSFFLLLAVAGNETTRNLISGGLLALIENPAERERLTKDPTLIPSAVEEMLRWVTPVMYFRRTAMKDTVLRGQKIREGEKVVMYYSSANRDEDVFANGDRFDVGRTPNDHLAFGAGQHFCLGSNLARLEIRAMFEEILRRMPDFELAGPVRRLRSNFINGFKQIPIRFTPERDEELPVSLPQLTTYPRGWFVAAFSSEIPALGVTSMRFFGQKLVAFRGEDGGVRVLDAYCSHMGADLAAGGVVVGDTIRCPFHSWRYCGTGECVDIPYAKKIPVKARQRAWTVREMNGVVLLWHDERGEAPTFDIPLIPEFGSSEWTPWNTTHYTVKTHPREIVDNLADKAHFPAVHRTEIDEFSFDVSGHTATQRVKGRAVLPDGGVDRFASSTTYHGPGYLLMRMNGAMQNYMLVAHTPVDTGSLELRLGVMLKNLPMEMAPIVKLYMSNLKAGFEDDMRIWENKLYRDVPVLCDGDGPITQLRRWYRQFYALPEEHTVAQQTTA